MKKVFCDIKKCMNCRRCELACYMKNAGTDDIFEAVRLTQPPVKNIELIQMENESMPFSCRQCDEPLCVDACISGALYIDEISRCVNLDKEKCVGCWSCIMRCPHGSIRISMHTASKCDNCYSKEKSACVNACPTGALTVDESI
ncbi:MAG: 4Fe-4S dicluster domain-containing protein [bacterium]